VLRLAQCCGKRGGRRELPVSTDFLETAGSPAHTLSERERCEPSKVPQVILSFLAPRLSAPARFLAPGNGKRFETNRKALRKSVSGATGGPVSLGLHARLCCADADQHHQLTADRLERRLAIADWRSVELLQLGGILRH
jgi:hypothetical protein